MTKAALKDLSGSVSVHRCPTQRWGAPPIPREHGAWVMIYISAAIGLTSVSRPSALYGLLFVVALTGTPVENRLADLWCIMDTLQPGALGGLKDFSAQYEKDPSEEDHGDVHDTHAQKTPPERGFQSS